MNVQVRCYHRNMDTTTTKNVMDIPASDRQALEHLLGTPLGPQQRVMIFSYTPGKLPADDAREAARSQIERMIATNQQLAINEGKTTEESAAAIDEAMAYMRPRH